jgi:hypothetical protein
VSDYSAEQDEITAAFQTRTLRRADGVTTERCGFGPRSGRAERVEGRDQERGEYVITLPGRTEVELDPGEVVTVDEIPGRAFTVVWTPPPSNLNLSRRYGANEVR